MTIPRDTGAGAPGGARPPIIIPPLLPPPQHDFMALPHSFLTRVLVEEMLLAIREPISVGSSGDGSSSSDGGGDGGGGGGSHIRSEGEDEGSKEYYG